VSMEPNGKTGLIGFGFLGQGERGERWTQRRTPGGKNATRRMASMAARGILNRTLESKMEIPVASP
jgi:hypothetical protein